MSNDSLITSEVIQMLVSSMTREGKPLQELEVERFLNALARAQSGVPTGVSSFVRSKGDLR